MRTRKPCVRLRVSFEMGRRCFFMTRRYYTGPARMNQARLLCGLERFVMPWYNNALSAYPVSMENVCIHAS